MLSTQQIDEDLWEFASSSTDTIVVAQCKNIIDEFPGITGGTQFCALQYIQKNGIMTEHSCPFAFGGLTNCFDKNKITPIVVRNVTTQSYVDSNVNISPQTIMNRYNYGTYLVTIQSFTVSEMDSIQLCSQSPNHAVLITGYFQVKTNNGTILTYLEIQNSWELLLN